MKDISENRLGELRTELVDSKYRLIDLMFLTIQQGPTKGLFFLQVYLTRI